jgi:hypothetical protein
MTQSNADASRPDGRTGGEGPSASLVAQFEAAANRRSLGGDQQSSMLADRLSQAVVEVTGMDGAALSVYLGADIAVPIGASDLGATAGEALQFTVREGPCFACYSRRGPVLVPDVLRSDSQAWSEWPTYADQLSRHTSYQAVFAFPLLKGALAMGSLSLYRRSAGEPEHVDELESMAACITDWLLDSEMITDAYGEQDYPWMGGSSAQRRHQVWLAQGLTLQRNRVTPGQALELLRAQAFSADRTLDDVAQDIVAGRMATPVLESQQ